MTTNVILPALGMSQDTGKIIQWLKAEGDQVIKGEPLAEIETDKATVEIEAPANGVLVRVSAAAGDDVPVGQVIATIIAPEEVSTLPGTSHHTPNSTSVSDKTVNQPGTASSTAAQNGTTVRPEVTRQPTIVASPLASRIASEHNLDLTQVKATGRRIQKADVLAHLQGQRAPAAVQTAARLIKASPKARRLAVEHGKELATITGTGPGGAILADDVLREQAHTPLLSIETAASTPDTTGTADRVNGSDLPLGNTWRIMAQRTTQSWTGVPHFYLEREVNASRLIAWHEHISQRSQEKVTYTDLLVKIVAAALHIHPRINAAWHEGKLTLQQEIHIGLAVAVEEGLVVPVIHRANTLGLEEIARQRKELVAKAQAGKLHLQDISDGTFTISNLGMYKIDAFNAIINQPQAAILAVGRIAERVVPLRGQPAIQPMMTLTLSCDHRAIDGARGAQFLSTLAELIEEPLGILS